MKNGRFLKGLGIVLITVGLFFLLQVKPLKDQAKQIAQRNEVRAQNRINQANSKMVMGIVIMVGGIVSFGVGINRKKR